MLLDVKPDMKEQLFLEAGNCLLWRLPWGANGVPIENSGIDVELTGSVITRQILT